MRGAEVGSEILFDRMADGGALRGQGASAACEILASPDSRRMPRPAVWSHHEHCRAPRHEPFSSKCQPLIGCACWLRAPRPAKIFCECSETTSVPLQWFPLCGRLLFGLPVYARVPPVNSSEGIPISRTAPGAIRVGQPGQHGCPPGWPTLL